MRMKKRISAFLIVCMVISMIPMTVSATQTEPVSPTEYRIMLDSTVPADQTSVWIDGIEYAVEGNGSERYVVAAGASEPGAMVIYRFHAGTEVHSRYPIGMQVWSLRKNADGTFITEKLEALTDILRYSGSSIRITGKKGIRMITSIDRDTKKALTSEGVAGYKLREYGTVVAWAKELESGTPLVLGAEGVKSNFAYKEGTADPVFRYDGNLMQYTNVLVGFTLDQCADDLAMRPYMILEDAEGNQITLYGGIVNRSIGYIAWQNRNVFKPGSKAYNYVWEIIRHVYAEVHFDTNGGPAMESIFVQKGNIGAKPADPQWEGHRFGGWYTDEKMNLEFDFTQPVSEDLTLYAYWMNDGTKPVKPANPSEADNYYFDNAEEVLDVIKANKSESVPTAAEAVQIFRDRGFTDCEIFYQYGMEGGTYTEGKALEAGTTKHPIYYAIYTTENDSIWTLYLFNGSLTAYPVSYLMETDVQVGVLLSEDGAMTGYDMENSVFYKIIAKQDFMNVKTVGRIDKQTLDTLTNEEIDKL